MKISETQNPLPFPDGRRAGLPLALKATRFESGGAGGYDISQSTSESSQQGGSIASPFSVGGGLKIPDWAWAAGLVLAGVIVVGLVKKMFFSK